MNRLSLHKRCQILQLLVEGNSIRGCSRIADVSTSTVLKLLVDVGKACVIFHSQTIKRIRAKRVQCDEMWSFVYNKQKNKKDSKSETGDVWTWVAIDQDTKLVISFYTGLRDLNAAKIFINDLYQRLLPQFNLKTQVTTDGYKAYQEAMADTFGGKINFAQLVKQYSKEYINQDGKIDKRERYIGAEKRIIAGRPDLSKVTTAHVERQNLNMRMGLRRLARDTNAFSKKIDNHWYAIALHFAYSNFCRIHKTLRVTPAMEAGLIKKPMTFEELAQLPDKFIS